MEKLYKKIFLSKFEIQIDKKALHHNLLQIFLLLRLQQPQLKLKQGNKTGYILQFS